MTTNKPEVLGYCVKRDREPWERSNNYYLSPNPDENYTVPVIRLSDYEALQAECEHYKSATVEIITRHFTERWVNAASNKELEQYLSDGIAQLEAEHRKQIEALQVECEKLREAIRRLCNIYVVDDYYSGDIREEQLSRAVDRAIDAAMRGDQP